MRFRTITETPLNPLSQVFRESRLTRIIAVLVGLMFVSLGLYIVWFRGERMGWLFAGGAALIPLIFGFRLVNSFRSENWLMRYGPPKLLIKIRSCDNHSFDDGDPVVMELDTSEVEWIRKVRETVVTKDSDGRQSETSTYLDLKLRDANLAELELKLKDERQRSHKGFKVLHYPVQAMPDGVIRVQWRGGSTWITPKVEQAIAMLKSVVDVHAEYSETRDYTVEPADKAAQEMQILELARSGKTIDAIKLARKRYGYSLRQAKDFVEELQGRSSTV